MKHPWHKHHFSPGFWLGCGFLTCALVFTGAMGCSTTMAQFAASRESGGSEFSIADYDVAVSSDSETLSADSCTVGLAAADLHTFTLNASGSASIGHTTVTVTGEQGTERYVIDIAPNETAQVEVQAAVGSEIAFSSTWGGGEDPETAQEAATSALTVSSGTTAKRTKKTARVVQIAQYSVGSTRTPHTEYQVAEGASLKGIADYYGVNLDDLCRYNGLGSILMSDASKPFLSLYPQQTTLDIPYVAEGTMSAYVPTGSVTLSAYSSGAVLPGRAAFTLYDQSHRVLETVTYAQMSASQTTFRDLPVGTYYLSLDKDSAQVDGYSFTRDSDAAVTVTENGVAAVSLGGAYERLTGSVRVAALVTGSNDDDFPQGAYVRIVGDEISAQTGYLAGSGSCSFSDLPTGVYTVTLYQTGMDGYELDEYNAVQSVTVTADSTTYVNYYLDYQPLPTETQEGVADQLP